MKLLRLAKSPWTWLVAILVCFSVVTSINTLEVINNGTSVARDFRIVVLPTKKVYGLGDIAPGETKSLWFIAMHDGAAVYTTTVNGAEVTGNAVGYFCVGNGRQCTLRLVGVLGKPEWVCQ